MRKLTVSEWLITVGLSVVCLLVVAFPLWQILQSKETFTIPAISYQNGDENPTITISVEASFDQLDETLQQSIINDDAYQTKVYAIFDELNGELTLRHVQLTRPDERIFLEGSFYLYNYGEEHLANTTYPIQLHVGQAIRHADVYEPNEPLIDYEYRWMATLRYNNGHALVIQLHKR